MRAKELSRNQEIDNFVLQQTAVESQPKDVMDQGNERNYKDSEMKGSIWRLISRGHLDLTNDRKIIAAKDNPNHDPAIEPYRPISQID